jgi:hypothetical protein
LVALTVRREEAPAVIDVGLAEILTVGMVAATTLIVAVAVA